MPHCSFAHLVCSRVWQTCDQISWLEYCQQCHYLDSACDHSQLSGTRLTVRHRDQEAERASQCVRRTKTKMEQTTWQGNLPRTQQRLDSQGHQARQRLSPRGWGYQTGELVNECVESYLGVRTYSCILTARFQHALAPCKADFGLCCEKNIEARGFAGTWRYAPPEYVKLMFLRPQNRRRR